MLGEAISDPEKIEEGGSINGIGLLNIETVLKTEKVRTQTKGKINKLDGFFSNLSGLEYEGYEIHVGESVVTDKESLDNTVISDKTGMVYGTYVHGIFDRKEIAEAVIKTLADKKGVTAGNEILLDYSSFKEKEYDKMADILREHLDMDKIYGMLKEAQIE